MEDGTNYFELETFAEELVQGSWNALSLANWITMDAFRMSYGREPSDEEQQVIDDLFPYENSERYSLDLSGDVTVGNDDDNQVFRNSEFIGGIAIACGIEPAEHEVETAVLMVGYKLGKLGK